MSKSDNKEIVNFYTLKGMQKYLPKVKDEQVKQSGMPLQKHILMCGGTGAGKTNSLMNYIEKTSVNGKPAFDHMMLVYKTDEPLYNYLKDHLKDNITMYNGFSKFPSVDSFPDAGPKHSKQCLLVFDDCIQATKKEMDLIRPYFIYGRKKNFTIVFLSQSFYQTDIFIRKQVSFVILNSINKKNDLRSILSDCAGSSDVDIDSLKNMYNYCKKKDDPTDIPFMKITCYEVDDDKKYSKGFLEYLNPEDFQNKSNKKKKESDSDTSEDDSSDDSDDSSKFNVKHCKIHPELLKYRTKK